MTRLRMKTTDHTHKYQDVVTAGSKIIYRFKKSNWTRTRRKKGKEESTLTVGVNDVKQQVESVSNSSSCDGFPLKVCNSHRYIWPLNVGCFNQSIGSFSRISRRPVIIIYVKQREGQKIEQNDERCELLSHKITRYFQENSLQPHDFDKGEKNSETYGCIIFILFAWSF